MEHWFGDHVLDDDPTRVDLDRLWAFLSTDAYWGRWRSRGQVAAQLAGSWRVVGVYDTSTSAMIGFARAVSDGVAFAYLADLYVSPQARGRGLGAELVRVMVDAGPGAGFRWALHTADAHALYHRFGFGAPDTSYMERAGDHPAPRPSHPLP